MAATASFLSSRGLTKISNNKAAAFWRRHRQPPPCTITMASQQQQQELQQQDELNLKDQQSVPQKEQKEAAATAGVEELPRQPMAKSKNMSREYGGQWLSCVTRHVRIYAAYIDPVTNAFDQTQMDKLTLLLDPTNEFVWTSETCQKIYDLFKELVDHYEGAPLTEYTLRLIGSDIEHYIRKLLYDGEIKYNMNAKVLNFSMGKPRVKFNSTQLQDVQ